MQNQTPTAWNPLRSLAEHAADGLHNLQTAIGVKQNTETLTRADLAAAISANGTYQATKTARLQAVAGERLVDSDAKLSLRTARDVLKKPLGDVYTQSWAEVGFLNNSLALPATLGGRIALLGSMAGYFTAHATLEVASLGVTAAALTGKHDALAGVVAAVATAEANQQSKRELRDAAVTALQHRLRGLVQELSKLLGPLDPRWKQFGFNEPGDDSRPATPEGLTVIPGAARHLQAEWNYTPGAARYHLYREVVGVDPEYVFVKTVTDTSATFNSFVSGAHVRVRLTAVNSAGESLPCAPVEQVVP